MSLTVVVPTRDEPAENVKMLIDQLKQHAMHGTRVLFVDDSDDMLTANAIQTTADAVRPVLDVEVMHRPKSDRIGGLAGSVALGFERAISEYVLVMDGDLQHSPSTIPTMLEALESGVDMVIASRYCDGGSADGLDGLVRRIVSRACTYLAKVLFPRRLRGVTDPMTGFFVVRRCCVNPAKIRASGFKILLEILVRHKLSIKEVPVQFAKRDAGKSKGTLAEGGKFLRQLVRLYSIQIKGG